MSQYGSRTAVCADPKTAMSAIYNKIIAVAVVSAWVLVFITVIMHRQTLKSDEKIVLPQWLAIEVLEMVR